MSLAGGPQQPQSSITPGIEMLTPTIPMPTVHNSLGALCAWRVSESSPYIAINFTYLSWLTYFCNHTFALCCKPDPCYPYSKHSIMQPSDFTSLPCYFTYNPPVYDRFSVETPSASPIHSPSPSPSPGDANCSPHHPLLAYRPPQATNTRVSSDFFKMQTAAAHQSPIRPSPVPQQNLLQVTSDDSVTSMSSSSSSSSSSGSSSSRSSLEMFSTPELARCSRCQRTPSTNIITGKSNMVQYGLNLWYCSRCAKMVGLVQG